MESFCKIREIYRAIVDFEIIMASKYGLSLNEGMLLCCLAKGKTLSSTEIAENLGLTCSNTSKVIKVVENKGLVKRSLGKKDKRNMLFTLTDKGYQSLARFEEGVNDIPPVLLAALRAI